ncbi:hypothetical protein, partial [Enterobacter mori]|uniref:hypothetical protein n=1 Tax=Enterobacter mori TaxID=539813 RepID=UPI0032AF40A1
DRPQQPAHGIDAVWVNGVLTCRDGQPTGARAGGFVARGARAAAGVEAAHADAARADAARADAARADAARADAPL